MLLDPPVVFHFNVTFLGLDPPVPDMAFQEVGGLEASLETEPLTEGGENRFQHQLPKPAKRSNLVLKRGVTTMASGLVLWCKKVLEGGLETEVKTKDITVTLLNELSIPVANWTVGNAWPVKWSPGNFDAMKNELAIETVEFACSTIVRDV